MSSAGVVGGVESKDRHGEIGMFDVNFEFEHHFRLGSASSLPGGRKWGKVSDLCLGIILPG